MEDAAAVTGVALATTSLFLSHFTQNPIYDACGSISIGLLLGATGAFLIRRNMRMISETSIPKNRESMVVNTMLMDPVVKSVHDVKSTIIGLDGARFKAEVQFDGKAVAGKYLRTIDMNLELQKIKKLQNNLELEEYLKSHGQKVVDQVAEEVDRIEIKIKKTVPEVRHCDLEII